ncbi:MAG: 6-phosphogluconolactonase [Bacteroidetes bacterium HGW-Bacteroidetes-4]|nr:MAG: 6-phosphogluconolactonase [Bacteroidetes bacterium HGW-Bacteroidetes-4]
MNYNIFKTKEAAAENLAEELYQIIQGLDKETITLAVSGGNTPYILFEQWANIYADKMDWQRLHFFWVDERCVAPDSPESNYGNTKKTLFDKINLPEANIHRIRGEQHPELEAERYAAEIGQFVPIVDGIPQFDIMLLGMGDDGHTASIFPPSIALFDSEAWVAATINPYNQQNRVTLTGLLINNAAQIRFLVTGAGKAKVLKELFKVEPGYHNYPASRVQPLTGKLSWILDQDAAKLLDE